MTVIALARRATLCPQQIHYHAQPAVTVCAAPASRATRRDGGNAVG
jgi:hypothetical protein